MTVYKFRRIANELGNDADENLEYFNCGVPSHLYLYIQGTTTIKKAMKNIKIACAIGGVSAQPTPAPAPVEKRAFMQMTDRQDSRNVPRSDDHIELTALWIKL